MRFIGFALREEASLAFPSLLWAHSPLSGFDQLIKLSFSQESTARVDTLAYSCAVLDLASRQI